MPAARDAEGNDLQMLSAKAHTAESFGRAVVSASLAAAAEKGGSKSGPIKMTLNVTITRIPRIGAWVCVGIEGFGTFCKLERQD